LWNENHPVLVEKKNYLHKELTEAIEAIGVLKQSDFIDNKSEVPFRLRS
jgi:hypothetical protein